MKDLANVEEPNGDCVDISSQGQPHFANGKNNLIASIHTPMESSDVSQDGESLLIQLQDRFEDARDALLENETGAYVLQMSEKVMNAGTMVWSFSKKAAWIIGTSSLVLVVPLLYEMDKEISTAASVEGISAAAADQPVTGDAGGNNVGEIASGAASKAAS